MQRFAAHAPACSTPAWLCGGPERIETPSPKPKAEAKGVVDTTPTETEGGASVAGVAHRHLAQPTVLRPSCLPCRQGKALIRGAQRPS